MQDLEHRRARRLYKSAWKLASSDPPNYRTAADLLLAAASLGLAEADYALATWYLFGRHFKKDLKKAITLLKRAHKAGNPDACFDLAVSFERGKGVPKDRQRAFELYLEGALRGDLDCYSQVSRCFWTGSGVKKNRTLSRLWEKEHERLLDRKQKSAMRKKT